MNNLFHQKEFKIIHIDMDCFYAAVEMRDNPSLRGIPIAIGGPSKSKGVLCTSNYEAREFGVKAAMPTFKAFSLCPHLKLVSPNFKKYEAISEQIREIFYKYTDKVETLSLDEAYLDVTHSSHYGGSATLIARAIQKEIYQVTGLSASAGVSFNKMLAKIASDWKKPAGLYVITPQQREDFVRELELKKIPGIGKVTSQSLERRGFKKCSDITNKGLFELISIFGKKNALDLYERCQGISNSKVTLRRKRKSFAIERTFFEPISGHDQISREFEVLYNKYNLRFENLDEFHLDEQEASHISLKVRFNDFTTLTKDFAIDQYICDELLRTRKLTTCCRKKLMNTILELFKAHKKEVRLMGIGIKLRKKTHRQLSFNWDNAS